MRVNHRIIEIAGPDDLSSLVEATMTASAMFFHRFCRMFRSYARSDVQPGSAIHADVEAQ